MGHPALLSRQGYIEPIENAEQYRSLDWGVAELAIASTDILVMSFRMILNGVKSPLYQSSSIFGQWFSGHLI